MAAGVRVYCTRECLRSHEAVSNLEGVICPVGARSPATHLSAGAYAKCQSVMGLVAADSFGVLNGCDAHVQSQAPAAKAWASR